VILIETKTLTGDVASVVFTSIPQDKTDLFYVVSYRGQVNDNSLLLHFNSLTTNSYVGTNLIAAGTSAISQSGTSTAFNLSGHTNFTASTFLSGQGYIKNYATTEVKNSLFYSVSNRSESSAGYLWTSAGQNASSTSAITSLTFTTTNGNLLTGTSISLYGITKGSDGITTTTP